MSKRAITTQFSLFAFAACAWAAAPFATVSAKEPFELNGSRVPIAGVPSWPVTAGDVIATPSGPATVVFSDGSSVELGRNSKARIQRAGNKSVLRLLQGAGKYSLASSPNLSLFVLDRPAATHPVTPGIISTSEAARRVFIAECDDDKDKTDKDNDKDRDKDKDHDRPPSPSPYR